MKHLGSNLGGKDCPSPTSNSAHTPSNYFAVACAVVACVLSAPVPTRAADCVPQPAGLASWWRAEGSTEDAVGGHHGITTAAPAFIAGQVGQAFSFDGPNDYVQVPYSANLNSTTYTVEAWVKPTAPVTDPDNQELIFGQSFGLAQLAVRAGTTGLLPRFQFGTGDMVNYPAAVATNDIPLNEYSHLVGTWDGTELKLYVNGLLNAQVTPSRAPVDSQCSFFIGGFSDSGACAYSGQFFQGDIDEVSYYTRALTNMEIQALYAAVSAGKCAPNPTTNCVPVPADWVSWWRAEDNAEDAVGGLNGTNSGGVGFAAGIVGQAFSFNGVDGEVQVGDRPELVMSNAFTAEAWSSRPERAPDRSARASSSTKKANTSWTGDPTARFVSRSKTPVRRWSGP